MKTIKLSTSILIYMISFCVYSQSKTDNIISVTPEGKAYSTPVWSPDGEKILVTNDHNDALYVIYLSENNKLEKLKSGQGIGYLANWSSDSKKVVFREKGDSNVFSELEVKSINIETKSERTLSKIQPDNTKTPLKPKKDVIVYINQQTLKLEAKKGIKGIPWVITEEEGQFYHPIVSPDQQKVIVHEGASIYVYSIYGKQPRKYLGEGLASGWFPDNTNIVSFEDKSDDGHDISASDLFSISTKSTQKVQLTNSRNMIETWGSISPQGNKIAFSDEKSGKIFIADLNL